MIPKKVKAFLSLLTAPSVSASVSNDWANTPLEERIQLTSYSFTPESEYIDEYPAPYLIPMRDFLESEGYNPDDYTIKETAAGWYCDYCGHKNLDAVDVCSDCLKYNGGFVDVF